MVIARMSATYCLRLLTKLSMHMYTALQPQLGIDTMKPSHFKLEVCHTVLKQLDSGLEAFLIQWQMS